MRIIEKGTKMIKFIKYTFVIYLISLIFLYIIYKIKNDELIMVYAAFGIIYAPIGALILYGLNRKYNFSMPIFLLVAIVATIIAFLIGMVIVFNFL